LKKKKNSRTSGHTKTPFIAQQFFKIANDALLRKEFKTFALSRTPFCFFKKIIMIRRKNHKSKFKVRLFLKKEIKNWIFVKSLMLQLERISVTFESKNKNREPNKGK
jgi:hypothetical protein